MQRTFPCVKGERLYQSETERDPIVVGTAAWYDWLEGHSAFTFVDSAGTFTARKSLRRPNGSSWNASRRRQGQLSRIQLGPSHALSLQRLQAAARALADEPAEGSWTPPATSGLSSPRMAIPVERSLLRTKLYRPRNQSDLIARPGLLECLNGGLGVPLTLVSAPAGFGKTTLLAQWVQTLDRPTAWLSLDNNDNELAVFLHSLVAALQGVFPDTFGATASLLSSAHFPPAERLVTLLINDLADVPDDVLLVLDDYHLVHNSDVHSFLDLLIEHLPSRLHLVLATRSDPPLPLGRWRARGYLHELRGTDLRFTLQETEAFLTGMLGSGAAHGFAGALEERTEGWIAVLRLAALSLRNTSDPAAFMERFHHFPDPYISRYLVEEILSQQAPFVQEVLERSSILEQFCAELCRATIDRDASSAQVQASLDWLEGSNLFLVPLDERHGWYRFHHLFQSLLEQRLQAHSSPEEIVVLHRRASAWYAEQGLIEEALGHALAAGDAPGVAQLVEAQVLRAFEHEQWLLMEHWLRLVPQEYIQSSPGLLFARVWTLQAHGQLADFPPLLMAAQQLVATSDSRAPDRDDPQRRLQRALLAIAWSHFQYQAGQAQASLQSARSALAWTPPGEGYVASMAHFFLAMASQATGQEEVALVTLQQALRELPARPTITARLLFAQALVYLPAGKLLQVEQTARHLLRLAQEVDLVLSHYWAHWLLGVVHYERNDLDAAVYHFSAVIANQHQAHFWIVQDAMSGLALAYRAQGLGTQAQETAHGLLEWVQEQHNMGALLTAYAFCGQLALVQDEVEFAEPWLELAGEQEGLGPMMFLEDPPITKARLLLAKGDAVSVEHGQALLTHLLQHVEAIHSTRKTINVLALQAWAYDLQGREAQALEALERALALARPGGFIRAFADVPKLSKVLEQLRRRRKAQQMVDKQQDAYLQRILVAMNSTPAQAGSTQALMKQEGLAPLTKRELHILRLLDKDLSNKEIARELVVTPGTVKMHTHNVYRKLSVNNRHAALTLAKALGLLPSEQAPKKNTEN